MDEVFQSGLPDTELRAFSRRADGPARVRGAVHLLAWAGSLALALGGTGAVSALGFAANAFFLGTLFAPFHECMHHTAFRSRRLNVLFGTLTGFLQLFSYTGYRPFHLAHHRFTHQPDGDPELAAAPALLAAWPRSFAVWLGLVSGLPLLAGKLAALLVCAVAPGRVWDRLLPYVPAPDRPRVAWESRLVLAGHAGLVALGAGAWPPLLAWPVTWLGAHAVLATLLLVEHTGLPSEGSMLDRTRSIETTGLVRYFMWNMPWHAEHHAWPSVPFWQVPALHARVVPLLVHVAPGYLRTHLAVVRATLLRR